jgi:hypothetical protein
MQRIMDIWNEMLWNVLNMEDCYDPNMIQGTNLNVM